MSSASTSSASAASAPASRWAPPMGTQAEREANLLACLPTDPLLLTDFVQSLTFGYVHDDEAKGVCRETRFRVGGRVSAPNVLRVSKLSYNRTSHKIHVDLAHVYKIHGAELVGFTLLATSTIRDYSTDGAYLMFEVLGKDGKPVNWLGCGDTWRPSTGIQSLRDPCWWIDRTPRFRDIEWRNEEYDEQDLVAAFFDLDIKRRTRLVEQLRFLYTVVHTMQHTDEKTGQVVPTSCTRTKFGLSLAPRDAHTVPIKEIRFRRKQHVVVITFDVTLSIGNMFMNHLTLRARVVPGDEPMLVFDDYGSVSDPSLSSLSGWVPSKGIVARPLFADPFGCIVREAKWTNASYVEGGVPDIQYKRVHDLPGHKHKLGKDDIAEEEQIEAPEGVKRPRV